MVKKEGIMPVECVGAERARELNIQTISDLANACAVEPSQGMARVVVKEAGKVHVVGCTNLVRVGKKGSQGNEYKAVAPNSCIPSGAKINRGGGPSRFKICPFEIVPLEQIESEE